MLSLMQYFISLDPMNQSYEIHFYFIRAVGYFDKNKTVDKNISFQQGDPVLE